MQNNQTQPHTEDQVIFDCTTEVQTSQSTEDDDDLSHLDFELDFRELTGKSDFGSILVVHRSSKMTTDDIKRLTGSATVKEIMRGNQIISDNSRVLDLIRTAVELVNHSESFEGLRCYQLDEQAQSTLYIMSDPAFIAALDMNVVGYEQLRIHATHAAHMVLMRDELGCIARYYDDTVSMLPNAKTGLTEGQPGCEQNWPAVVTRSAYQLCLMSYEDAVDDLRTNMSPQW
jgi:hypothetical protein